MFKVQGKEVYFTLAFEDPYNGTLEGYKGVILEGNNPKAAIEQLVDNKVKEMPWGRYYTEENGARLRTVLEFTDVTKTSQK